MEDDFDVDFNRENRPNKVKVEFGKTINSDIKNDSDTVENVIRYATTIIMFEGSSRLSSRWLSTHHNINAFSAHTA